MASRFAVGTAFSWNGTAGTKWSTTSNGAGGSAEPTSSDDVFFDSHSPNVTLVGDRNCKSLNCTGYTGTFNCTDGSNLNVFGNCTFAAGMTLGSSGPGIVFKATGTLTTGGVTLPTLLFVYAAGITVSLADNLALNGPLVLYYGTLASNDHNVTAQMFQRDDVDLTGSAAVLTMGAGTWTFTGNDSGPSFLGTWNIVSTTGLTINANTSTIKFTDTTSNTKTFEGKSLTYNNAWLSGSGSGSFAVKGSNTFNDFKVDTPPHTITFTAGTTQTVTTFSVNGAAGSLMTLQSTSGGSAWNLSCASGAVVSNFLSLKDSHAAGGASFVARSSTNVSGNTGWSFVSPGAQMMGMFL